MHASRPQTLLHEDERSRKNCFLRLPGFGDVMHFVSFASQQQKNKNWKARNTCSWCCHKEFRVCCTCKSFGRLRPVATWTRKSIDTFSIRTPSFVVSLLSSSIGRGLPSLSQFFWSKFDGIIMSSSAIFILDLKGKVRPVLSALFAWWRWRSDLFRQ